MIQTKQAELEYKLRIYLKHININKYFHQYISELKNKYNLTDEYENINNLNQIINNLNQIFDSIQIMNRTGNKWCGETKYSINENIDDFIDNIQIVNMNDKVLDILLEHFNFINNKYILYENNTNV